MPPNAISIKELRDAVTQAKAAAENIRSLATTTDTETASTLRTLAGAQLKMAINLLAKSEVPTNGAK